MRLKLGTGVSILVAILVAAPAQAHRERLGVARHVDAGYEAAERTALEKEINIPLL